MSSSSEAILPEGPLIAWYGDDYTGASAVMEVLSLAGLDAVLFLDIPDETQLSAFADYRAVGIAGDARAQSPEWMELNLPEISVPSQILTLKFSTTRFAPPWTLRPMSDPSAKRWKSPSRF